MSASKQDLLFRIGHRDRLRQKFLDDKLSDDEMLELLLADVIPRRDVRPLARGLSQKFGGVANVLAASIDELMRFPGVGRNTAVHLKLIHRILCLGYKDQLKKNTVFYNPQVLLNYCWAKLSDKSVEEFHVLYLDSNYYLLEDEVNSIGTLDWAPMFERNMIKTALNLNATYLVLVHNHPVGSSNFSSDDIDATQKLEVMLNAVGLRLYDHFVVVAGRVYSMRNEGFLNKSATSQTTSMGA